MKRNNTSRRTASASRSVKRTSASTSRMASSNVASAAMFSGASPSRTFASTSAASSTSRVASRGLASASTKKSGSTVSSRRNITTVAASSKEFSALGFNTAAPVAFNVTPVASMAAPKLNTAKVSFARNFTTAAISIAAPLTSKFTMSQKKSLVDSIVRSFSTSDLPRERGTVKWFDTAKGYGFITRDSGADIFVHFSALPEITPEGASRPLLRTLTEGQVVEFSVGSSAKGPCAVECVPLVQDQ